MRVCELIEWLRKSDPLAVVTVNGDMDKLLRVDCLEMLGQVYIWSENGLRAKNSTGEIK
jgi:hypothetical protein